MIKQTPTDASKHFTNFENSLVSVDDIASRQISISSLKTPEKCWKTSDYVTKQFYKNRGKKSKYGGIKPFNSPTKELRSSHDCNIFKTESRIMTSINMPDSSCNDLILKGDQLKHNSIIKNNYKESGNQKSNKNTAKATEFMKYLLNQHLIELENTENLRENRNKDYSSNFKKNSSKTRINSSHDCENLLNKTQYYSSVNKLALGRARQHKLNEEQNKGIRNIDANQFLINNQKVLKSKNLNQSSSRKSRSSKKNATYKYLDSRSGARIKSNNRFFKVTGRKCNQLEWSQKYIYPVDSKPKEENEVSKSRNMFLYDENALNFKSLNNSSADASHKLKTDKAGLKCSPFITNLCKKKDVEWILNNNCGFDSSDFIKRSTVRISNFKRMQHKIYSNERNNKINTSIEKLLSSCLFTKGGWCAQKDKKHECELVIKEIDIKFETKEGCHHGISADSSAINLKEERLCHAKSSGQLHKESLNQKQQSISKKNSRKILSKPKKLNMDLESINIKIQPLKVLINRSNTSNISTYFKNKDEGKEYIDTQERQNKVDNNSQTIAQNQYNIKTKFEENKRKCIILNKPEFQLFNNEKADSPISINGPKLRGK